MPVPTPSQTAGPYVSLGTEWLVAESVVAEEAPGAVVLFGKVFDGEGRPVTDAMIEFWQEGEQAGEAVVTRLLTGPDGGYRLGVVKPAPGEAGAPHIDISIFARGLLQRLVTRTYFEDEPAANSEDPVLAALPLGRRGTLVARPGAQGGTNYNFDIYLQGEKETVFFAPE